MEPDLPETWEQLSLTKHPSFCAYLASQPSRAISVLNHCNSEYVSLILHDREPGWGVKAAFSTHSWALTSSTETSQS